MITTTRSVEVDAPRTIWIFNQFAISPDMPGGSRHFDLCHELSRRGFRTTIFSSGFNYTRHEELKLDPGERWRLEVIDGVRFIWLRTLPYARNNWRRAANMVSYLLEATRAARGSGPFRLPPERPDIVIGSSVHLLAALAGWLVARFHHARFIMEVRDIWPLTIVELGEMGERHPAVLVFKMLEQFLYRKAERIITLLPHAHVYFASCGVPADKVVWIPNGVDLTRFPKSINAEANSGELHIMYSGAHGRANTLDNVLRAAQRLQERKTAGVTFDFIGDGAEKQNLLGLARDLGLRNVVFREPVAKQQVPAELRKADILIASAEKTPLYRYGLSLNKLFDYMAAGKPVLFCVDASNNPVEEAGCGISVPPRDPEALADAIVRLQKMPREKREEMGRRGREYVEKYHAIPVLAERLIQCIDGLPPRS